MKIISLKTTVLFSLLFVAGYCQSVFGADNEPTQYPGWELVWHDEFDVDGPPNSEVWNHERGFVRNEELQWYQQGNTNCENGLLKIEARREQVKNPNYQAGSSDWKKNREYANYTSASITTGGSHSWLYGRFEVRAKIPTPKGSWPAIWTVGKGGEWPSSGEIDILEYYLVGGNPHILANAAWGTEDRWVAKWAGERYPYTEITGGNPNWGDEFHVWRMDWDEDYIRLYLDDRLLNEVDLTLTINADGSNAFHRPQYLLLNLAIGGNGGDPSNTQFPLVYEIDYARVYQREKTNYETTSVPESGETYLIRHYNNSFLTFNGTDENSTITQATGELNQQFKFTRVSSKVGNYYRIQDAATGYYLCKVDGKALYVEDYTSLPSELHSVFKVEPASDSTHVLLKVNETYLTTEDCYDNNPVYTNGRDVLPPAYWQICLLSDEVDKTSLKKVIDESDAFVENTMPGTSIGQYPEEEYAVLANSLLEAKKLYTNTDATLAQIYEMRDKLQADLADCRSKVILTAAAGVEYMIYNAGGYQLGVKGTGAGIYTATQSDDRHFEFVPVAGETNVYNVKHIKTGKYLAKNSYNTVWSDDTSAGASKVKLLIENDKLKLRFEDTGAAVNKRYLGSDDSASDASVYADKDGTGWKHHWFVEQVNYSGQVDFTGFNAALAQALLYKNSTTAVGSGALECPAKDFVEFASVVEKGENLNRSKTVQLKVDMLKDELNRVTDVFKPVLKRELTDSIAYATKLVAEAEVGTDRGQYPQAAVDALNSAISEAQAGLENESNKYQEDFNAETAKLIAALEAFRVAQIPLSNNESSASSLNVYMANSTIYIDNLEGTNTISIYTLQGTLLFTQVWAQQNFNHSLPKGSYILSVKGTVNANTVVLVW